MSPRQPENLLLYDMGKVPPQAIEIEEAVLGALLVDPNCYKVVGDMLIPELFYKENHKIIYNAIKSLHEKSIAVDIRIVANQLRSTNELEIIGGYFALTTLIMNIVGSLNIEYHIRILIQMYLKREMIRIGSDIFQKGYDNSVDVFDLIEEAEKNVNSVSGNRLIQRSDISMNLLVRAMIKNIETTSLNENNISGIPTGYNVFDRKTYGLHKTDLTIIAARPGMSKTSLMLNIANNISINNKVPSVIFSLEMSSVQIMLRILSARTGIPNDTFKSGRLSTEEWMIVNDQAGKMLDSPLYIDDTAALSHQDLKQRCRKYKEQFGVDVVFVDYLQLMNAGKGFRGEKTVELSEISKSLKAIAKELNVSVVALSQLNREVERRNDKRPMLSDLLGTGSIEADSDMVCFIYRDDYYNIDSEPGKTELIIAKHRSGALGTVLLQFTAENTRFTDYNEILLNDISYPF